MRRLLLLACLAACGDKEPVDTGPGDTEAHPGWCDTAQPLTWSNFGQELLLTHCQGCHAADAPERYGAPPGVTFDTEADAVRQAGAIRATVLEMATMPPAGGLTEGELEWLEVWLSCGL